MQNVEQGSCVYQLFWGVDSTKKIEPTKSIDYEADTLTTRPRAGDVCSCETCTNRMNIRQSYARNIILKVKQTHSMNTNILALAG